MLKVYQKFFRSSIILPFEKNNRCCSNAGKSSSHVNRFASMRSHNCGELRLHDVGKKVSLCGWVHFKRGAAAKFILMRDAYGITQAIVLDPELFAISRTLSYEAVVRAKGLVVKRPKGQENPKFPTGEIELVVESLEVLNTCKDLPFQVNDKISGEINENVRLQYRYLDLRRATMQKSLRLRATIVDRMRRFLIDKGGFLEIETPTLFRRTPGGAAEFIVPSSAFPGQFYSLTQSPQQFKQLLMVGGFDRYFQVARCYRDESARFDRQPEFTQIDIELSFATQRDVMDVIEELIVESWPPNFPVAAPSRPFLVMSYDTAIETYGCDKPDLRFDWLLNDYAGNLPETDDGFGENAKWFQIPNGQNLITVEQRKELVDRLVTIPFAASHIRVYDKTSLESSNLTLGADSALHHGSDDDLYVFASDAKRMNVLQSLGYLRTQLAAIVDEKLGGKFFGDQFKFLWVVDFPLFLPKEAGQVVEGEGVLESAHHPFTAPIAEHLPLIWEQPELVLGQHYDIVLNGLELGGGSIRIHDPKLQRYVLDEVLKEDSTNLSHLLEALECGAPPHGGIALGLDRYIALLLKLPSVRDAIAFPKSSRGRDFLADAPSAVTAKELERYHVTVARELHSLKGDYKRTLPI